MTNNRFFEFTQDEFFTLVDCVRDRLENVEDAIGFQESQFGDTVHAGILRDVRKELEELLAHLQN